jgi:uncharacterized protein (DUF58 family)
VRGRLIGRRRLRRWLRPPRTLRPTRAGWCFFALTLGVGFAALNTGNNLLYLVLALMLAFLVLSGVLSESALRGIEIRRRLPRELFAEAGASVGLEIRNAQRRVPAFALVVEDHLREPGGAERVCGRAFALRIGPGETALRSYRLLPPRRGTLELSGFRVSTRFPFGLFLKALASERVQAALVYPAVEPLSVPEALGSPRRGEESGASAGTAGSVAAGLREFAPGDSMRRIHWPASLRRRALLVRTLEPEQRPEVEVRLRTAGAVAGEPFESKVRFAASEVVALLEAGRRVALRTDAAHLAAAAGEAQRARLLAFLARVEPGAAATAEAS